MDAIDPRTRWSVIHDASRGVPASDIAGERKIKRTIVDLVLEHWVLSKQLMNADYPSVKKDAALRLVREGYRPVRVWMNYFYDVSLAELEAATKAKP